MSDQQPRRPANLPAGTSSLADRIAALQRKSSTSSKAGPASRSSSATVGGGSVHAGTDGGPSGLPSAGSSPARSVSSGSQAVKDRIARFQNHEKPLIPKSSFGAPSPMSNERHANVLRPYPGANASGSGSGQWGENILRPQMTGGTWVGAGEGKGWAEAGSVRPQLTGGAWVGYCGSMSPGGQAARAKIQSRSPIRQRDAFLDLDEEVGTSTGLAPTREPLRRGSSFSEAQMAAASTALSRRSASTDGSEGKSVPAASSPEGAGNESALSLLPDTPSKIPQGFQSKESSIPKSGIETPTILLPTPPSKEPIVNVASPPRDTQASGDVEIEVAGASPSKLAQLRRTLSGSHDSADVQTNGKSDADEPPAVLPAPALPASMLRDIESLRRRDTTRSSASSDDGTSAIGRLAIKSETDEDEVRSQGDSTIVSPPPKAAELPPILETSPLEPNGLHRQEDSVDSSTTSKSTLPTVADTTFRSSDESVIQPIPKGIRSIPALRESGVLDPMMMTDESTRYTGTNGSDGTLSASTSAATNTTLPADEFRAISLDSQRKAKEAVAVARSKSQRVKRPPVGRPMTVAEMEASDDDYEPGWASVISSTSNRT